MQVAQKLNNNFNCTSNGFVILFFSQQLKEQITTYNLNDIAEKLSQTANSIPNNNPSMSEVRTSLRNQALHLRTYQENLVDPMTEQTIEMMQLTKELDESFKFNSDSFNEGIDNILAEIEAAKKFIDTEATTFVRDVIFNQL